MTKKVRLYLSICSTFLLLTLGLEYLWDFYHQSDPFTSRVIVKTVSAYTQYLLLGTVAIYIAHNFMLLFFFVPGPKDTKKDRAKLIKEHRNRYSTQRANLSKLILIGGIVAGLCGVNYYIEMIDKNILIWGILLITSITIRNVKIKN